MSSRTRIFILGRLILLKRYIKNCTKKYRKKCKKFLWDGGGMVPSHLHIPLTVVVGLITATIGGI